MNIKKIFNPICAFLCVVIVIVIMYISSRMIYPYPYIKLSFMDGLTIIVAILFAYFLMERGNDQRQKREYCERLIVKIQIQLNEECLLKPTVEKQKIVLLTIRSVQNKITILTELLGSDKTKYIKENFDRYEEFFGEHYDDQRYLDSSEVEFKRIITSVLDKLEAVLSGVYK